MVARLALVAASALLVALVLLMWHGGASPSSAAPRAQEGARSDRALLVTPCEGEDPTERTEEAEGAPPSPEPSAAAQRKTLTWAEAKPFFEDIVELSEGDDTFVDWAKRWPRGVTSTGRPRVPSFSSPALNPEGKPIGPVVAEELTRLVLDYDERLQDLGERAFDLAQEALGQYYESELFELTPTVQPEPPYAAPEWTGHWNKSCAVEHGGWRVRVRFDSADFPVLDDHLGEIERLRDERLSAVREYIAGL